MNPLVSIIIPAFNRAHLIAETLESILAQKYIHWECIVVDDGSTDNIVEVLKKYISKDNRFKYFCRPEYKIKGANACRNYGLEKVNGDYIIFLDSDDLLAPNCLENRVAHFIANPEYDMLVFSMGHFETSDNCYIDQSRSLVNLPLEETIVEFVFGRKLPWNITRPIYKSELLLNRIWLNEKIHNFQDDEFHIRILGFLRPRYSSIDETDCYYRIDQASLNKYNSEKGYQDIQNSLFEYYTTIFHVFDSTQKKRFRKKVIQKLFNQIRFYVLPKSNLKILKQTITLFDKELLLTVKELFLLKSMMYLNLFYHNKKGYYKLRKYLFKKN